MHRTRPLYALLHLLLGITFGLLLCIGNSGAAFAQTLEAPRLSAKVLKRSRGVEVRVTLPRSLQRSKIRRKLSLLLERDIGAGFATVAQFDRPQRSFRFRDRYATNGTYAYRAWVTGTPGQSGYSATVSVSAGTPPPPPPSGGADCHDVPLPAGVGECPAGYEDQVLNLSLIHISEPTRPN